ncbi:MAG: hypothetical protein NVS9B15_12940 [Acidobacteriaceae bacterium]
MKGPRLRLEIRDLSCGAGVGADVGDAGDEPFAVHADHVEEVGVAVIDLAVLVARLRHSGCWGAFPTLTGGAS